MPSVVRTVRRIPTAKLLIAADLVLLARRHVVRLEPQERHRIVVLLRRGRGRPRNLTERERRELARLVQKTAPLEFANVATKRLIGVPLPWSGAREGAGAKRD